MKTLLILALAILSSCGKSEMDQPKQTSTLESNLSPKTSLLGKKDLCLKKCLITKSECDVAAQKFSWEPGKTVYASKCTTRESECKEYCNECDQANWNEAVFIQTKDILLSCNPKPGTDIQECTYYGRSEKIFCKESAYIDDGIFNSDFSN